MRHNLTRITGDARNGYSVNFDSEATVVVNIAPDYSGLACSSCKAGDCEHIAALRSVGYCLAQPELDELWLHSLPPLPEPLRYSVTTTGIWHGVQHEGRTFSDEQVDHYRLPKKFRSGRRRMTEVWLTRLSLTKAEPERITCLYRIEDVTTAIPGGVQHSTIARVPKVSATEVRRLIARSYNPKENDDERSNKSRRTSASGRTNSAGR